MTVRESAAEEPCPECGEAVAVPELTPPGGSIAPETTCGHSIVFRFDADGEYTLSRFGE